MYNFYMIIRGNWKGIIEHYFNFLPVTKDTPIVTLLEGNTPLIYSEKFSKTFNIKVYFKFEGLNPTGSFKDRGMTVAISKAKESGYQAVICASTGNTAASAASYATKGGLKAYVLIPEGKIALGKLSQSLIHGAKVIEVMGNFDHALKIVKEVTKKYKIGFVNSLNPFRIEGQKTGSFEIVDELKKAPDYIFIPVGNGGNITSYWKGFKEYFNKKKINSLPRMYGWQAEGAAPIVLGKVVEKPETFATAIRIGNPARWIDVVQAIKESDGNIDFVSDDEIREAYEKIAAIEGIFCEPASASSLAGLIKTVKRNQIQKKSTVVLILTGHGLKDPDSVMFKKKVIKLENNLKKAFSFFEDKEKIEKK